MRLSRHPFTFRVILGCLRALLVFGLALGVALALVVRDVKAEAETALLGFGEELMHWANTSTHGKPRRLTLNGLDFKLVTLSTSLPVKDVVERLHMLCRERGGVLPPEEALRMPARDKGSLPRLVDGTITTVTEHEGFIACLDTTRPLDVTELARRLERVVEKGELSELGELRYMLARREGNTTTALVLWTEGSFPLLRAFPAKDDAPGVDPRNCPRPAGSRRLLSALEHGAPYSVTIYSVPDSAPSRLDAWYGDALAGAGWRVRRGAGETFLAEQGERRLMIHVDRSAAGEITATVLELS
ncbi:MAG TPA: hypothetical protein VHC69_09115 [Polyangiaceae bacterium]|nr:hypothetical protein [Polyangiaceae bacterium]